MAKINITPEELAVELFKIHSHENKTGKIIYYEKDLISVFERIGLPKPKFSGKKYLSLLQKIQ